MEELAENLVANYLRNNNSSIKRSAEDALAQYKNRSDHNLSQNLIHQNVRHDFPVQPRYIFNTSNELGKRQRFNSFDILLSASTLVCRTIMHMQHDVPIQSAHDTESRACRIRTDSYCLELSRLEDVREF